MRVRKVTIARLLMLWVFVVSLYFLWEADGYRGLYAFLAEIQFDLFGQQWPVLTFALLVIIFGSPAAWLFKGRRARQSDASQSTPVDTLPMDTLEVSTNFRRALFSFAGGLAGAAVITLLWTLTLPRLAPPTATIDVARPQAATPTLGSVTLRGGIVYERTSAFAQNLFVARRGIRFAPMIAGDSRDDHIRYFVELLPQEGRNPEKRPAITDRTGVLIRNNLPGSIVRLYRYAGYRVEKPFYVLYASNNTIRWPYYLTAMQLAIAALLSLIAALVQHRHVRHIRSGTTPDARPAN